MKTLISKRLILRPAQTTDIPALSEMPGDPEIMKYLIDERGPRVLFYVERDGPDKDRV